MQRGDPGGLARRGLRYFAALDRRRTILWCSFLWYVMMTVRYADRDLSLWPHSLGIATIVGVILALNATPPNGRICDLGFWPVLRFFSHTLLRRKFFRLHKGPRVLSDLSAETGGKYHVWRHPRPLLRHRVGCEETLIILPRLLTAPHPLPFMKTKLSAMRPLFCSAVTAMVVAFTQPAARAETPQVGDLARDFSLQTLDGKVIELKALSARSPVLLVVLRGWPGYQCPICSRQVNDYIGKAADFTAQGVQVLMVYPGPADQLKAHAGEFLTNRQWPADFLYVIDPDYAFTNAYGLRWDAPKETAYPSTFVIDREGRVRFAHVSKGHGDRVSAAAALETLAALK